MAEAQRLSERALERRVKRWLASGPHECFVQCAPGLEGTLVRELRQLGFSPQEPVTGGVPLELDGPGIMTANLRLRSASRVLLRLGNFPGGSREMLYDRARRLPWENHLGFRGLYRLHMVASSSWLQAGDELKQIIHDAISRRLEQHGLQAGYSDEAELEVHVRLLNDHCTVSLNTSGEHLHKRGFRRCIGEAPLRETVAAAAVLEAWDGHDLIHDPFCGAGTLLLEAADLVSGLAPGRARGFAFEHAAWFRPGQWREVQRQAALIPAADPQPQLSGADLSAEAASAAARNLEAAGHAQVQLTTADALEPGALQDLPGERRLLLSNLPWGRRLGDERSTRELLEKFARQLAGSGRWDFMLLTTQPEVLQRTRGLKISSVTRVQSGGLKISMIKGRTAG